VDWGITNQQREELSANPILNWENVNISSSLHLDREIRDEPILFLIQKKI
tara:strand:+ start:1765 stop:1914 length:150 start_codon:yes stop_codon:yes gene_type:complete